MVHILAFDVGTSTLKAALISEQGQVLAKASSKYGFIIPNEGYAEQVPTDWWNAVVITTKAVLEESKVDAGNVKGVVFATQAIGIVPISKEDGMPLSNAIIWNDARAGEEAIEIMNAVGGPETFEEMAGFRLNGKDVVPKILWLNKNKNELFEQMECFLDVNGYLIYKCTGEKVYDYASASAVCYDFEAGEMNATLLGATGFDPEAFPRLVKAEEKVGNLTKEAAAELGLTTDTMVFGGTNDMQATTLGSGMNKIGECHFCLGTSGWCVGVSDVNELLSNGGASIISAEYGKFIRFYQPESACTAFNWYVENLYKREIEEMGIDNFYKFVEEEVRDIPPGSDYLIFNPWFAGERSPVTDMFIRGGFLNLGFSHTRAHMLRAVLEGIAYNLRWSYEGFVKDYGYGIDAIRMLGGGAKNEVWMQIFADIFNIRVEVTSNSQEAGAIGAAFLAALGLGLMNDFDEVKKWTSVDRIFTPNPENVEKYEEMFQNFKKSYDSVKTLYRDMNKSRIEE